MVVPVFVVVVVATEVGGLHKSPTTKGCTPSYCCEGATQSATVEDDRCFHEHTSMPMAVLIGDTDNHRQKQRDIKTPHLPSPSPKKTLFPSPPL